MSKLLVLVVGDVGFDPTSQIVYIASGANFTEIDIEHRIRKADRVVGLFSHKVVMADEVWVVTDRREPKCVKSRFRASNFATGVEQWWTI